MLGDSLDPLRLHAIDGEPCLQAISARVAQIAAFTPAEQVVQHTDPQGAARQSQLRDPERLEYPEQDRSPACDDVLPLGFHPGELDTPCIAGNEQRLAQLLQ